MIAVAHAAVAADHDAAVLGRIVAPETHLAIWQRPRPPGLGWLDTLCWEAIDNLDFAAAVDRLDAEIADGLAEAGYPQDENGAALCVEIVALARRFAAVMACDEVTIRLEVVEGDSCRKFHADLVTARLLATLSGPGTQWIDAGKPDAIRQLAPGDVAILKGRRWAEEPLVLHRSPPIAGTGAVRLVLATDPARPALPGVPHAPGH